MFFECCLILTILTQRYLLLNYYIGLLNLKLVDENRLRNLQNAQVLQIKSIPIDNTPDLYTVGLLEWLFTTM